MAVWSSDPPKVPTPLPPGRLRKLCPFSAHARYMARSMPLRMFSLKAVRSWSLLTMAMAQKHIIISADEPLMPLPTGMSLEKAMSTPARGASPPKLAATLCAVVMG